jgi:hypothetical protein
MGTSAVWKRENAEQWGDEALTRGLKHWGRNVSPIEAKFLFRGLIYATLAAPIEGSDAMQDGAVLRMGWSRDGRCGIPLFTHPDLLKKFAADQGWCPEGGEVCWTAVQGKELFKSLADVDGIEVWINPGSSSLRLNQAMVRQLAAGEIPNPQQFALTPRPEARRPLGIQPAVDQVPAGVLATMRATLATFPRVAAAMLYKPPNSPITLGLRISGPHDVAIDEAVRKIETSLWRAGQPITVVVLTPEMQNALSVEPFYNRAL